MKAILLMLFVGLPLGWLLTVIFEPKKMKTAFDYGKKGVHNFGYIFAFYSVFSFQSWLISCIDLTILIALTFIIASIYGSFLISKGKSIAIREKAKKLVWEEIAAKDYLPDLIADSKARSVGNDDLARTIYVRLRAEQLEEIIKKENAIRQKRHYALQGSLNLTTFIVFSLINSSLVLGDYQDVNKSVFSHLTGVASEEAQFKKAFKDYKKRYPVLDSTHQSYQAEAEKEVRQHIEVYLSSKQTIEETLQGYRLEDSNQIKKASLSEKEILVSVTKKRQKNPASKIILEQKTLAKTKKSASLRTQEKPQSCFFKTVMTDTDYFKCGLKPPS